MARAHARCWPIDQSGVFTEGVLIMKHEISSVAGGLLPSHHCPTQRNFLGLLPPQLPLIVPGLDSQIPATTRWARSALWGRRRRNARTFLCQAERNASDGLVLIMWDNGCINQHFFWYVPKKKQLSNQICCS